MSELMTDLDWWAATRYPSADEEWGPDGGRHAYNEDAALTPIFHALTRSGWRSRQHQPAYGSDPVDEFRREPLTAPIPAQAPSATRTRPSDTGRHRRVR